MPSYSEIDPKLHPADQLKIINVLKEYPEYQLKFNKVGDHSYSIYPDIDSSLNFNISLNPKRYREVTFSSRLYDPPSYKVYNSKSDKYINIDNLVIHLVDWIKSVVREYFNHFANPTDYIEEYNKSLGIDNNLFSESASEYEDHKKLNLLFDIAERKIIEKLSLNSSSEIKQLQQDINDLKNMVVKNQKNDWMRIIYSTSFAYLFQKTFNSQLVKDLLNDILIEFTRLISENPNLLY